MKENQKNQTPATGGNVVTDSIKKAWAWYKERRRLRKEARKKPMTFKEQAVSWAKTIVGAIIVVMIINGLAIASFVVPTGSMQKTVMAGDFLFVNKFIYGPSTPQVIPFLNIPLPFFRFPGLREPEQGDVIVFIYPGERNELKPKNFEYYLKRCIAVAGDSLLIVNKRVFVNGVEFPLPPNAAAPIYPVNNAPAPSPYGKGFTFDNYGPIRVPKEGDILQLNNNNIAEWKIFIEREGHKVSFDINTITIDGSATTEYKVQRNYCFGMGDNRDDSKDSRDWGFIPYENVVGTPIMVYWSWSPEIEMKNLGEKLKSIRWSRLCTFIR